MQWKDLERITKENEEKKTLIVYVHHNSEDFPVFKLREDNSVEKGRVYIGPYSCWNKKHDMSFEAEVKRLTLENERLQNELWDLRNRIEKVKVIL